MTTDLITQEHKLVTWAGEHAAGAIERSQEIARATIAAEAVKGLVITSDTENSIAEDQAAQIVRGQKALDAVKRPLLDILNAMRKAIGDRAEPKTTLFAQRVQEVNAAQASYVRRTREAAEKEQREREAAAKAAVEAERQRVEREAEETRRMLLESGAAPEAASAAAQDILDEAEEIVPLEDPPAPIPTATVRGSGTMSVAIKTLKAEIADLAVIDPAFVEIRQKAACDWARREIVRENMAPPGVGRENAVKVAGLWLWYEESRSRRAT